MPSNRHNLILDEEGFQALLSAAFTVQEHSDRLKLVRPIETNPLARSEAGADCFCQHCGALKSPEEARCRKCGCDEFRPGERMQRNWASLWLMSQERGLWPERPADESAVPRKVGEASKTRDSADDRYLAAPLARDEVRRGPQPIASSPIDVRTIDSRPIRPETIHRRFRDESVGDRADPERADPENLAAESEWTAESPALATETSTPEDLDLAAQASELSADRGHLLGGYRSLTDGTTFDEIPTDAVTTDAITRDADPASPRHRFGDLRVILRFHRADLYLGVAVFVAAVALMWPAASAPRPSALGPMDRALIALGIAEAPAPAAVHSKGDPGVNVWVDPHTALYYCPGEELYGKAADGRVSTQHDAQMDRFQPAGRTPCE